MADEVMKTPYSTATPFITDPGATWMTEYDGIRTSTYDLYDDLYHNDPSTYRLLLRGSNELPIFVPTAKKVVNTLARYVGKGWGFNVEVAELTEDGEEAATDQPEAVPEGMGELVAAVGALFKRERLLSKFTYGKKEWLRRGDWIWMISADPEKPEGRRISIDVIDPRNYFPTEDERNLNRLTGCQIIEEYLMDDGETMALRVQTYMKPNHPEYQEGWGEEIAYSDVIYALEDFTDVEKRQTLLVNVELEALPGITSMPVYHIRNNEESQNPFGRSDLAGLETIIAGINQSISDEDLSLAMAGLGMYVTNSARPIDDNGEEVDWQFGPQRVVELGAANAGEQDIFLERIDGITSVEPFQDHVGFLNRSIEAVTGISDVATGASGATESGVALILRLAPLLDAADEKDLAITDAMNQLLHDLRQWMEVYEGIGSEGLEIVSVMDKSTRIPFDRDAMLKELLSLFDAGAISLEFLQGELADKFGYKFSATELQTTKDDAVRKAQTADAFATRAATELNDDSGDDDDPEAQ